MENVEERLRENLKDYKVIEVLRNLHSHIGLWDSEDLLQELKREIQMLRAKGRWELTFSELKDNNQESYENFLAKIIYCIKEYGFKIR